MSIGTLNMASNTVLIWFILSCIFVGIDPTTAEIDVQNVTYKATSAVYMNITKPISHFEEKNETVRIVIGLFDNELPKTTENFRKLCTAESGQGYKGSRIFRKFVGFQIQGGDFEFNNGTGGKSIYKDRDDGLFDVESTKIEHSSAGFVSMEPILIGKTHFVGSRFLITIRSLNHLDKRYSAFGKVLEGQGHVDNISYLLSNEDHSPKHPVVITDCGIWKLDKPVDIQSTITTFRHSEL